MLLHVWHVVPDVRVHVEVDGNGLAEGQEDKEGVLGDEAKLVQHGTLDRGEHLSQLARNVENS